MMYFTLKHLYLTDLKGMDWMITSYRGEVRLGWDCCPGLVANLLENHAETIHRSISSARRGYFGRNGGMKCIFGACDRIV
jgi:hypothetical protein